MRVFFGVIFLAIAAVMLYSMLGVIVIAGGGVDFKAALVTFVAAIGASMFAFFKDEPMRSIGGAMAFAGAVTLAIMMWFS